MLSESSSNRFLSFAAYDIYLSSTQLASVLSGLQNCGPKLDQIEYQESVLNGISS
jgi:hypothetical protein